MKRIAISNSNAFILVYSIDDAESFEEVRRLRELIYEIKLEKHIAKYSKNNTIINKQTEQQTSIKNDIFLKKEPAVQTNSISPIRQQIPKPTEHRRHSLNSQMNGNGRIGLGLVNQLNGRLNGRLNNQLNSQLNNQSNKFNGQLNNNQFNNELNHLNNQLNNQTKRRHHHHKHPESKKSNSTKPYILTNINQRYKLSENLKLVSERRKSLTNSTQLSEINKLRSKLGNISENLNDLTNQSITADILCLRPNPTNKLHTTSLPVYSSDRSEQLKQQTKFNDKADDIIEEEDLINKCSKGRRRSSFLLSPDSCSSCSSSDEDSECESSNCENSCSSKSSSCCSLNNLNLKLDHKQDKENKFNFVDQQLNHIEQTKNNFEHINDLNNYKSKLESKKEQEKLLLNDDMPPFESPVIVVVGNKCDLECKRTVQKELAENIVQIDWDSGFIECSAKNNFNMTNIFKEMLRQSKLPFVVSNALDSQKNRRRSLPAYPSNNLHHHLREPNFRTKRNSCALS